MEGALLGEMTIDDLKARWETAGTARRPRKRPISLHVSKGPVINPAKGKFETACHVSQVSTLKNRREASKRLFSQCSQKAQEHAFFKAQENKNLRTTS